MLWDRALSCVPCGSRDRNLRIRTNAPEDEPLDRVSEAIVTIAAGHKIRSPPHLRIAVAHSDAEPAALEHRDVIVAIADYAMSAVGTANSFAISENAVPVLARG